MLPIASYEVLRERPDKKVSAYHTWYDLLFLHYSIEPELIQALLPAGLTVDTYPNAHGEERAWVGLVPFGMRDIRMPGAPALPWIGTFLETNVRTYVHKAGEKPGVWFFSLDAARWIACKVARLQYHLPYFHAKMEMHRNGSHVMYRSSRFERPPAELELEYEIGAPTPSPRPGSLEFFLVERYLLYSECKGELFTGMVHHPPYQVQQAQVLGVKETMIQSAGLPQNPWEHALFCSGVDVEVYNIESWDPQKVGTVVPMIPVSENVVGEISCMQRA